MSVRKYSIIFSAIFIVLILPLFINLIFSHPTFDDFYYSEKTRHFGFFEAQLKWYKYWTGKFFSTLILSVNPLLFRSMPGYDLMLFAINLLTPVLLYKILKDFLGNSLSAIQRSTVSLAIYFVFLYSMPSVSQGFYWMTGSVVYHLPVLLIMLFTIIYGRLSITKSPWKRSMTIAAASLTLVAITGCSEIAMVLICSLFVSFLLLKYKAQGRVHSYDLIFIAALVIGSSIVLLAPGNELRGNSFPLRHDMMNSLISTAKELAKILLTWIFLTPLLPVTLLLIPILQKSSKQTENLSIFMRLNPLYYALCLLFVVSTCLFATIWSTGLMPFKRTLNPVSFVFVVGFIFIFHLIFARTDLDKDRISRSILKYAYVPLFAILIYVGFVKNNIRSSFADLLTGTAFSFDVIMKDRYEFIKQSNSELIEVSQIVDVPRTFYFTDITDDKDFELNKWYAQYFRKKAIILKK